MQILFIKNKSGAEVCCYSLRNVSKGHGFRNQYLVVKCTVYAQCRYGGHVFCADCHLYLQMNYYYLP